MIDPLFKSKQAKDESSFPLPMLLLLCVFMLLASPLAAQTVDVRDACDPNINDPEAASYKVDYDGNGLLEICYLEDLNAMRYALDGSAYTTSTDATPNASGCPTPSGATEPRCRGYELVRDLDFLDPTSYKNSTDNLTLYTEDAGWEPVGKFGITGNMPFTAIFNGNRYTLSNLRIDRPDTAPLALFGYIKGGTVMNVGLLNVKIRGLFRVGGLVGWTNNNVRITGNYVSGGSVEGTSNDINAFGVGGLIGELDDSTASSNYANVTVIASAAGGGLIGYLEDLTASNNYAAGNVASDNIAGGFSARADFRVSSNYARGAVSGNSSVGGFVGSVRDNENIHFTNNYWDMDASSQRHSAAEAPGEITGLRTVEMITPTAPGTTSSEAYYNWDTAYWDFGNELQYPALRYTTANLALGQEVGELLGHQRSRLDSLTVSRPDATTQNLIAFTPERFNYELVVPHTSERIAVQPLPDTRHATLTIIVNDTPQPMTVDAPYIINLNEIGTYTTITVAAKRPYYLMAEHYTIAVFRDTPPTLSTLTLSDEALAFDEATTDYELAVANSVAALTMEATASDQNAEITVYRDHIAESQRESLGTPITLAEGTTTTLLIRVAVPNKGENLYTVRVKRAPSANAQLAALGFAHDAALITFNAATTQYNVEVEGRQRVTVELETANEHASVVVESNGNPIAADTKGNYPIDLVVGKETKIRIFITAQDRITMEIYTIAVTQQVGAQAILTGLRLTYTTGSQDFELTTQTSTYSAEVTVSTQTRLYLTASPGADVEVMIGSRRISTQTELEYYPITLAVGTITRIAITITAQDGEATTSYTLEITQQASSQAQLQSLKLSHGTLVPNFSATTLTYRLATTHTRTYLRLSASVAATISVSIASQAISPDLQGGYLIDLSQSPVQITITITAQDGKTTKIYTLTAARTTQPTADAIYIRSRIFLEAPLP